MSLRHVVVGTALLLTAGVAVATTTRFKSMLPMGGELATADGMAKITFMSGQGTSDVRIHLYGFTPNTWYGVVAGSNAAQVEIGQAILTDANGNANFQSTAGGDATDSILNPASVIIFLDNGTDAGVFDPGDEVRALGALSQ